ncbi:MAG: flagellar biosynthesis anti-sigma factor FlgM [Deltaproteobacteria bacterium]|nr:flagellar biosynthesis anti-sigma factor FlgM [Deltaproteobacteria bacterium]
MEISGKIPLVKIGAYVDNVKKNNNIGSSSAQTPKSVQQGDKVKLSQTMRDVNAARGQLDSIPDIQEERVAEIRDQIDKGTYRIDGKKIAFNMIREAFIDETV